MEPAPEVAAAEQTTAEQLAAAVAVGINPIVTYITWLSCTAK
jgi:hypothetical protein